MTIRVLLKESPERAVALATEDHILTFKYNRVDINESRNPSTTGQNGASQASQHQCMVDFSPTAGLDLRDFRSPTYQNIHGTLGLVSIGPDVYLCVVNGANRVASAYTGENIQQITSVEFYCINRAEHDFSLHDQGNRYATDSLDDDGIDSRHPQPPLEHPCQALKKLLSGGTFYYSADFDLTRRLQDRSADSPSIALDSLDRGFLWNAFMIQPLVSFRSRLSEKERSALDDSRILTSAIRGFAMTLTIPAASSPVSTNFSGRASTLTLISRLSCKRAGTRFNARGIDDDGNVANFVETETILWAPTGLVFSYVQIRGSVPVFWEQAASFNPGQQKLHITRSPEATQPAFDKHFSEMESNYGAVHIVNLLGDKSSEMELTQRYSYHVAKSPLNHQGNEGKTGGHDLLRETNYDFHAETRGLGYEAAQSIRYKIQESADAFVYFMSEEVEEQPKAGPKRQPVTVRRPVTVLQQEGIFRTNCLDCLDRTNVVQTIISQLALEEFIQHRGEKRSSADFWLRHSTLWADNGDALSKIYAGTGALKSSFTRSGKMSLAGALADVRKSATRLYINNFEDKGRQNTIDLLLGRLMGQSEVHLFDPINDYVSAELLRRTSEYTSSKTIALFAATFNLNGKHRGLREDLSSWLCPQLRSKDDQPEIVAVGFQEIVELSPQQIMSTDPKRRVAWEDAVKDTLNEASKRVGGEEYVLLRGGQLVGASLSVFVRASMLPYIKNVEGSVKKTGMSGMAGNKGAVAIRMDFANTSICLLTAHLAAGFANYEERNQDYRTISHGLRFQRNRSIEDHDTVIWMGDFNYRIGMSNERARQLISKGDLETLYENDQLHLQMVHGKTFPHYSEARITFFPTYKYDNGTDEYDTSEKARIPAWTDRVLSKGDNLRQTDYSTAPLKFSDHRPVYAIFQCMVNVVDEEARKETSDRLYQKRRVALLDGTNAVTSQSDDDDLQDYESIEPGLPPASSEKRKWWLDGGMPAKATVRPPGDNFVPNQARPSNPWTPSSEPDWVKVEKPSPTPKPAAPPPRRAGGTRSDSIKSTDSGRRRVLAPPYQQPGAKLSGTANGNDAPPPLPSRVSSFPTTVTDDSDKAGSKKGAPVVPKKPLMLRTASTSSEASAAMPPALPSRDRLGSVGSLTSSIASETVGARSKPGTPPARRSATKPPSQQSLPPRTSQTASTKPLIPARQSNALPPQPIALSKTPSAAGYKLPTKIPARSSPTPPAAPPRNQPPGGVQIMSKTPSTSLMDDKAGDLGGWEPLQPS